MEELKSQNLLLREQIATLSSVPGKDQLENRIKDLNQRNLALTVELDQERIIIDDLKNELSDARSIKQEVLERGKASKLKSDLLNEELGDAKNRIQSLEKALVAAREAIRVLQGGGNRGSMIQVSNPRYNSWITKSVQLDLLSSFWLIETYLKFFLKRESNRLPNKGFFLMRNIGQDQSKEVTSSQELLLKLEMHLHVPV
jgi:hypothetical protein